MYDQKLLKSRTGTLLLQLFDEMERIMSQLYHITPLDSSQESKDLEERYIRVYDKIENLREIRNRVISKKKYDIF